MTGNSPNYMNESLYSLATVPTYLSCLLEHGRDTLLVREDLQCPQLEVVLLRKVCRNY